MGPEKLKLFNTINISLLFPSLSNAERINTLWKSFVKIYSVLRSTVPLNEEQVDGLQKEIQEWIILFKSIYQSKHITPYIHLLVSQFLKMYGTIAPFSQQGLEKLNDDLTKDYFRSTNHKSNEALQQMLLKLNRLEELRDRNYVRSKSVHLCKLCKQPGHNSRTCKETQHNVGTDVDINYQFENGDEMHQS